MRDAAGGASVAVDGWLIEKSALVRLGPSPAAAERANRIERGLVRITTVTLLDVGFSARTGSDLRDATSRPPLSAMLVEHLTPASEDRDFDLTAGVTSQPVERLTVPRPPGPHPPSVRRYNDGTS